ncbi:MAG: hypothetical protein J7498_14620 [Sphingobium sp.]|nr:hypothetical protein [Sphingobium sp.]
MTDETPATPDVTAAPAATVPATTASAPTAPLSGKGKAFWAGVGIGSAAIVAAVMYTRRPKKTRR